MRNQFHYNDAHFDAYHDLRLVRTSTESSKSFKWIKQNRRWFRIGRDMKTFSLLKLLSSLFHWQSYYWLRLSIPTAVYGKVARSPHFFSILWWMKSCVLPRQSMTLWELIRWRVNNYATWNVQMMWCAFLIQRKVNTLFWTDLQELSFHSVCALHLQIVKWCTRNGTLLSHLSTSMVLA